MISTFEKKNVRTFIKLLFSSILLLSSIYNIETRRFTRNDTFGFSNVLKRGNVARTVV